MTTIDPFERELPVALADLADAQTPDYFIDLLGRTARTRQRPAWAIPGRWFTSMPGFTARPALALVAIVIVAVVGGAFILGRSDQGVGPPTTTASPGPSSTPYPSPQPLPSALIGGWLAPLRDSPIVQERASSIYFGALNGDPAAPDFAIGGPGGGEWNAPGTVRETAPGLIEVVARGSLGGCTIGDVGHYRWSTTADGAWLTLVKVDDACANRAGIAAGTWVRDGSADNRGGPVVQANFDPIFSFTLPAGVWLGGGGNGVITADADPATFKVWQDPDGFKDFCDHTQGTTVLERGIDPFLAYLRESSGLTVSNQREATVDGRRAVVVDIGGRSDVARPCWTNPDNGESSMILQWSQHADPSARWATEIGSSPWPIVITEVDGHTLVFEAVTGANTLDQATLDSVRFLDALPTAPPPSS